MDNGTTDLWLWRDCETTLVSTEKTDGLTELINHGSYEDYLLPGLVGTEDSRQIQSSTLEITNVILVKNTYMLILISFTLLNNYRQKFF